jgi:predicted lipid-binding transport protein (Tim44 family)
MRSRFMKLATVALGLAAAALLTFDNADARPGRGGSLGSRGDRTFSAPPTTNTAPKAAQPMDRTMTQQGAATASAAKAATTTAATQSRFGSMGGLMKGLLLGGLMGALFSGIFGAGALASILGFVLQTALIAGVVLLALSFLRNRMGGGKPAMATASAGAAPQTAQNANYRQATGPIGGGGHLVIVDQDFNAFERLLGEIQGAYGRGDVKALEPRTTPEMLSYFAEELDQNSKQGMRNEVSAAKLLQGDLSEAWREASGEYASVAMRYSILDATIETRSGRVVSGSRSEPQEVTEVWTFRRPGGGTPDQWELSAIQQTG